MPRISVVVPIYNVERYLRTCLDSIARQTFTDLEVVMVDDGSLDGSGAIAEEFAANDDRFKLVRQANGGLSSARNTGIAAATGEFLSFVDSDDVLPPDACALLIGALVRTGSDFATGNVRRLTPRGTRQAAFLAEAFAGTRLRTHITAFRPLLADRTAWNKLFRRSFWDAMGFRFPEGRLHEDIPVTLPAHFAARSVDVIAEPVYLWRVRDEGDRSITQRRLEHGMLLDRAAALEEVVDYLDRHGPAEAKGWYLESVVREDLRYHLELLDRADERYQALFIEHANAILDGTDDGIFASLPAIERLKWHLIRRKRLAELLEVIRFGREERLRTRPVRIDGHWHGDYPFRTAPDLRIPASVFRLEPGRDPELALRWRLARPLPVVARRRLSRLLRRVRPRR